MELRRKRSPDVPHVLVVLRNADGLATDCEEFEAGISIECFDMRRNVSVMKIWA